MLTRFGHRVRWAAVWVLLLIWLVTLMAGLGGPLANLFPDEPAPSLHDFVGLTCTIRTGRVDGDFGQAEVAARDGSTAVVQVRQNDGARLELGSTGLLYAYDDTGELAPRRFDAARTNDLGEYRLFWMPPGQYIVSAQGTESASPNPGEMVTLEIPAGGRGPGGPGALGGLVGERGGQLRVGVRDRSRRGGFVRRSTASSCSRSASPQ